MSLINNLVTSHTEIIDLDNTSTTKEEKKKVLGLKSDKNEEYIKNMYLYKGVWHYFKDDDELYYSLANELVGSYLASGRGLPTVTYKIARTNKKLGIASSNFKKEGFKYEVLSEIIDADLSYKDPLKLELLLSIPDDEENKKEFIKHLFDLFALDIHMIQKDRADVNLQFQTDLKTGFFDLAPIYDYSLCSSSIGREGINIPSKITRLDYLHIISLARRNKEFKEALERIFDEDMVSTWDKIGEDYNFDMNSIDFIKMRSYFETKEEKQKKYIKELLSRV